MAETEQRTGQQAAGWGGSWVGGIHLATLAAFAISQPLLDLLRQHPSFLSAQRAGPGQIFSLVSFLSLAIPAIFFACGVMGGFLPRRLQSLWTAIWVGLLSSLIALPIGVHRFPESSPLIEAAVVIAALAVGLAAALGYRKWPTARQFLAFLSPAILIFPLVFLSSPVIRKLVLPAPPIEIHQIGELPPLPIIVVIFDEFPLPALLGEDRLIHAAKFPNFARLAETSHWYPNATSVEIATVRALPAVLTGRSIPTDRKRSPTYAEYPQNLFTWLGGSTKLEVVESFTHLCPAELCESPQNASEGSTTATRFSFRGTVADLALVYCHFAFPPTWTQSLPSLGGRWGRFWQDGDETFQGASGEPTADEPGMGDRRARRDEVFQGFIDRLQPPDDSSRLYFLHVLLPHWPWEYLPDLKRYNNPLSTPGRGRAEPNTWHQDPWYSQAGYARLDLQIQATDRLLGRLMTRLEELALWDPALVLVTADHGLSFEPGENIRGYANREALLTELLPIPLFLKTPGQRQGSIDHRLAENVDLLPTLADLLGVSIPWETEGYSLVEDRQRALEQASIQRVFGFPVAHREELTEAKYKDLKRKLGQARGDERRDPLLDGYRFWRDELLDRPMEDFVIGPSSGDTVILSRPEFYREVDLASGFVPAHVMGNFRHAEGGVSSLPASNPAAHEFLAVVLNGTIHGIARTEEPKGNRFPFSTIVPSEAFVDGENLVEVLRIQENPAGGVSLVAVDMTDAQTFAQGRFLASNAPLSVIGSETEFIGVEALHLIQTHRQRGSAALTLDAEGMDPALLLPSVPPSDARSLNLAIDLTVPEDTELRVFFQTESEPRFWWGNSVRHPIAAGRSKIFMELYSDEGFLGPLRLDPGNRPGRYLLHSIEIRESQGPSAMLSDTDVTGPG